MKRFKPLLIPLTLTAVLLAWLALQAVELLFFDGNPAPVWAISCILGGAVAFCAAIAGLFWYIQVKREKKR